MADPDPSEVAVALDGRALGRRGAQTRQRLLDATARLLEDNGLRELRVVDIARAVDLAPATFYQYFHDVEEAVLALSVAVGEETSSLSALVAQSWSGADGLAVVRRLVEDFIANWDHHPRCCAPGTSPRRRVTRAFGPCATTP